MSGHYRRQRLYEHRSRGGFVPGDVPALARRVGGGRGRAADAAVRQAAHNAYARGRLVRDLGGSLRSYLRDKRGARGVEVRTFGRGGPHPLIPGTSAAGYHVVHDRRAGKVAVIGTDARGAPTMAHEWPTAPAVVRPAGGRGDPNYDIPILGPIERIAHSVQGVFQDIGHLFGIN
nr:MAG: hypothetical protein [clictolig virus 1]